MCENLKNQTSYTLLDRALDLNDEDAWREMHEKYRKYIYFLLHRLEVAPSEVEEFAQQVMVGLMTKLKQYDRQKGKFRAWLSVVVRNEVLQSYRQQQSRSRMLERYANELEQASSGEGTDLDKVILTEWQQYIFDLAKERMRGHASASAIEVMDLTLAGYTVDEIVTKVGVAKGTVYNLRQIVKQLLSKQVQVVRRELEG